MLFRKRIGQIDAGATMRRPVTVVNDGTNVTIHIWIEMLTALAMVNPSRDHVKGMRNDACADKQLAFCIVIDAPRVTEAVRNYLKTSFRGVIPPYPAVDVYAFPVLPVRLFQ